MAKAKVTVNRPDDPFEREADRMADLVVQRQVNLAEEEDELQAKPLGNQRQFEEKENELQTKRPPSTMPSVSPAIESGIQSLRQGGGLPLPTAVRGALEPHFGYSFANVRVHTDGKAASLARGLQARAFTVGRDIFFDQGEFQTGNPDGKKLLAHELTHTIQQGPSLLLKHPSIETPGDGAAPDFLATKIQRLEARDSRPQRTPANPAPRTSERQERLECLSLVKPDLVTELRFDGVSLVVQHSDGTCAQAPAVSGKFTEKSFSKFFQRIREKAEELGRTEITRDARELWRFFKTELSGRDRLDLLQELEVASGSEINGPIPNGIFMIDPRKQRAPLDQGSKDACAMVKAIPSGWQEVTASELRGCWGSLRIKITNSTGGNILPVSKQEGVGSLSKRNSFYIHAGKDQVTRGCIKVLGGRSEEFLRSLTKIRQSTPLVVGKKKKSAEIILKALRERALNQLLQGEWRGSFTIGAFGSDTTPMRLTITTIGPGKIKGEYHYNSSQGEQRGTLKGNVIGDSVFFLWSEDGGEGRGSWQHITGDFLAGTWGRGDAKEGGGIWRLEGKIE